MRRSMLGAMTNNTPLPQQSHDTADPSGTDGRDQNQQPFPQSTDGQIPGFTPQSSYAPNGAPAAAYPQQPPQGPHTPFSGPQPASGGAGIPNASTPGQQQPAGYPYPPQGYYAPHPQQRWNVMSIIGFVMSFVFAPVGLALSIVALMQINKSREQGKPLAIAGIVVGAVITVLVILCIVFVIWAFAHYASSYGYDGGYYGGYYDTDLEDIMRMAWRC